MTTHQTVTKIGYCRLEELPSLYREAFENGNANEGALIFVPAGHSLLFFAVLTVAFLGVGGFFVAALISGGPIFPLEPGASILGPIIVILICLAFLGTGFWSLRQLIRSIGRRRREKSGDIRYGLRLDEQALVARYLTRTSQDKCIYLPRQNIKNAGVTRELWLGRMWTYYASLADTQKNLYSIPGKYLKPSKQQHEQADAPVMGESDRRAAYTTAQLILKWLQ